MNRFLVLIIASVISLGTFANFSCKGNESLFKLNYIDNYPYYNHLMLRDDQREVVQLKIDPKLKSRWFEPKNQTKRVSIVFHGLNFRSDHMDDVINELTDSGSKVLNVSLPGFREEKDPETGNLVEDTVVIFPSPYSRSNLVHTIDKLKDHPERNPTLNSILDQMMLAYCLGRNEADRLGVKLNVSAFSMSGVFITTLLNHPLNYRNLRIDNMILYAPAFMSNSLSNLIQLLTRVFPNVKTPVNNESYNYNDYIRAKYYRPLADAVEILDEHGFERANIRTQVLVKEHDQVITPSKLRSVMSDNNLNQWNLKTIRRSYVIPEEKDLGHIITMREYTSYNIWMDIRRTIDNFFEEE